MNDKGLEYAKKAAHEFGATAYANGKRTSMNSDDRLDIAFYYGVDAWTDISNEHRGELLQSFNAGVQAERDLVNWKW